MKDLALDKTMPLYTKIYFMLYDILEGMEKAGIEPSEELEAFMHTAYVPITLYREAVKHGK